MSTAYNQSKIKQFRRCQKQYSYRFDYGKYYPQLNGVGPEMVPKTHKLPLYRGSWMHSLQETLHHQWAGDVPFTIVLGEGRSAKRWEVSSWQETHEHLTEAYEELFDEEKDDLGYDLPEECERLFKAYLRFWKDDRDRYQVATVNGKPAIELLVQAPLKKFGVTGNFKGRIDLIVEDWEYDGLWIWDGKWMSKIPIPDERMMSPQALLYVWALREHYGLDVRGFVFNYGRTKPPAIPRVLRDGTLSLAKKMDTDFHTYMSAIKEQHGKYWKRYIPYYREKLESLRGRDALWFDRARIPVEDERILRGVREYLTTVSDIRGREKRRDYVPRTYQYSCKWNCEYHALCTAEFQGLEIEPLIKQYMQFVPERYDEVDLLKD